MLRLQRNLKKVVQTTRHEKINIGGEVFYGISKVIRSSDLTSECWPVQIRGLRYCSGMENREPCEFLATKECGGHRIRHEILGAATRRTVFLILTMLNDNKEVIQTSEEENEDDLFGPVIYEYTAEQAVEDGILVYVGNVGKEKVYFTRALFDQGYEDMKKRIELVNKGLRMLGQPDHEDTKYMKLRVIEKDKIWLIQDGQGYTFMLPSDY